MKPLFLLFLTLSVLAARSTPTDGKNVTPAVAASFQKTFAGATDVNWTETEIYFKVQFQLDGRYVAAYFSKSGDVLGISKNLASTQLPTGLQPGWKNLLDNGWISELVELKSSEGTTYYLTLENGEERLTLRSLKDQWQTFRKETK